MHDIIIVGAGVAGMTAALYSLRANKSVLLLEEETFGGQAALSPRIENFPSVKQISGAELTQQLLDQILELGADIEPERVTGIKKEKDIFTVTTEYSSYLAGSVIIATGVKHKHLNVSGEKELIGKGVSYCAVCDGAFFKGEDVALIGDANTALQYAISLSSLCNKVYVCTLFDRFFGEQSLINSLKEKKNVTIIHNIALKSYEGIDSLSGLIFENTLDKSILKLDVTGCFVCIGQQADNKAFENIIATDKDGFIVAGEDCKTSCEGIFAAGDCRTKTVRQITTAAADGSVAAIAACGYLDALK